MPFGNMEPDHFMKRGFLLPEGCKDLTDVCWKVKAQGASKHLPSPQPAHSQGKTVKLKPQKKSVVHLPSRVSVRNLAIALGASLPAIIRLLKQMKMFTSVDQKIPFYCAAKVAAKCGFQASKKNFPNT
jgi:hypothetical protein